VKIEVTTALNGCLISLVFGRKPSRRAKPASKVDFDKEIIMRSFSSASIAAAVALGNFLGL